METETSLDVEVVSREQLAPDVVLLELAPIAGTLPPFAAGAHIDLHLPGGTRQYSLCGSPADSARYRIAVLRERESRGGSAAVHALRAGETLRIGAPRNLFPLAQGDEAILIGGGIGITPLLAMAHELELRGTPFALHYVLERDRAAPFAAALGAAPLAGRSALHRTDMAAGRLFDAAAVLPAYRTGLELYVCGPRGFMDAVIETARMVGWDAGAIHKEHFDTSPIVDGDRSFVVRARRSGLDVHVAADRTIAEALLDAGIDVPLSCEQGVCGTCLTAIVEGEADHRDLCQTEAEQMAQRSIALCCSRARTAMLVLDI